jgi:hypothetical protein
VYSADQSADIIQIPHLNPHAALCSVCQRLRFYFPSAKSIANTSNVSSAIDAGVYFEFHVTSSHNFKWLPR